MLLQVTREVQPARVHARCEQSLFDGAVAVQSEHAVGHRPEWRAIGLAAMGLEAGSPREVDLTAVVRHWC
jgi:hypothetical protein